MKSTNEVKRRGVRPPDNDFLLGQQIAELKGITMKGFEVIDIHLTTLNGQVLDHSKIINKILAKEAGDDGKIMGISAAWKVVVTILTLMLAALAIYVTYKYHLPQ